MSTFRGLPPEVLETLGLDPEGDEDEPDEPPGPYELPHRIAEFSPPKGVAGPGGDQPGGSAPSVSRRHDRRFADRPHGSAPHEQKNGRPARRTAAKAMPSRAPDRDQREG